MKNDVYDEPVLIEMPNAVVRVYHPILTEEEQQKRMKAIHDAAAKLLQEVERKNTSKERSSD